MGITTHLVHIRPCASFSLLSEIEQYVCTNYRNIRPMWASENIMKNDRWNDVDREAWNRDIWPDIKKDLILRGIIDSSYEGC